MALPNSYGDVQAFFNDFVRANEMDLSGSPHQEFWNTLTYEQFVNGDVPGVPGVRILVKGSAATANRIAILKGPISGPGEVISQMPEGGPYMSDDMVAALSSWIDRECPRFAAGDAAFSGLVCSEGRPACVSHHGHASQVFSIGSWQSWSRRGFRHAEDE